MLKLIIAGNLGKDAELKEINGQLVISFSVAISQNYTNAEGAKVEKTMWINCSKWQEKGSKTGLVQYLKKGSKVIVEGVPEINMYRANDGVMKADFRCRVKEVHLLSSTAEKSNGVADTVISDATGFNEPKDDLPF